MSSKEHQAIMDGLDAILSIQLRTQLRPIIDMCEEINWGHVAETIYRMWTNALTAEVGEDAAKAFRNALVAKAKGK